MTTQQYKLMAVPVGWKVVPGEPTTEQLENCGPVEGYDYDRKTSDRDHSVWYTAMVKEAPQLDMPPVLRWEGEELFVGDQFLAHVSNLDHIGCDSKWSCINGKNGFCGSLSEARRAAEKALGIPFEVEEV